MPSTLPFPLMKHSVVAGRQCTFEGHFSQIITPNARARVCGFRAERSPLLAAGSRRTATLLRQTRGSLDDAHDSVEALGR
jgi:hypothetical protein